MNRRARTTATALLLALPVVVPPSRAAAQDATVYATTSADGYDTNIALLGTSVRPGGLGLRPSLGLQVYRLQYDSGGDDVTRWAFTPSAGVNYRMAQGALEARVGYSFQSGDDDSAPFLEGEGGRNGVTTALQGNYWGGGPELQGIASYAWRSDYLWSQAQATVPLLPVGLGTLSAGAEAVWQGELETEGPGEAYRSWSAGPVLKLSTGRQSSVVVGTGFKDSNSGEDGTWYARVGLVRYGIEF